MTNTKSFKEVESEIIETFSFLDDWATRYEHIIDLGKGLDDFPDRLKIPSNKIEGANLRFGFTAKLKMAYCILVPLVIPLL